MFSKSRLGLVFVATASIIAGGSVVAAGATAHAVRPSASPAAVNHGQPLVPSGGLTSLLPFRTGAMVDQVAPVGQLVDGVVPSGVAATTHLLGEHVYGLQSAPVTQPDGHTLISALGGVESPDGGIIITGGLAFPETPGFHYLTTAHSFGMPTSDVIGAFVGPVAKVTVQTAAGVRDARLWSSPNRPSVHLVFAPDVPGFGHTFTAYSADGTVVGTAVNGDIGSGS